MEDQDFDQRWASFRAGDEGARAKLLAFYEPLARMIAERAVAQAAPLDERTRAASATLAAALDRWNGEPASFAAYARACILGSLRHTR